MTARVFKRDNPNMVQFFLTITDQIKNGMGFDAVVSSCDFSRFDETAISQLRMMLFGYLIAMKRRAKDALARGDVDGHRELLHIERLYAFVFERSNAALLREKGTVVGEVIKRG